MNPPPDTATSPNAASIEKVRSGQRFILFAILLNFLVVVVALVGPKTDPVATIVSLFVAVVLLISVVLALVGVVRLSSGLGYGIPARVLIIMTMFIPLISLLVLLVLSSKATRILRSSGYKVGLLGAARTTD